MTTDFEMKKDSRLCLFALAGLAGMAIEYLVQLFFALRLGYGTSPFRIDGIDGVTLMSLSAAGIVQGFLLAFSCLRAARLALACAGGWGVLLSLCVASMLTHRHLDCAWILVGQVLLQGAVFLVLAAKNRRDFKYELLALAVAPILYLSAIILSSFHGTSLIPALILSLSFRVLQSFAYLSLACRSLKVDARTAHVGVLLLLALNAYGVVSQFLPSVTGILPQAIQPFAQSGFNHLRSIAGMAAFLMLSSVSKRAALLGGAYYVLQWAAYLSAGFGSSLGSAFALMFPAVNLVVVLLAFAALVQLRDRFPRWGFYGVQVWAGFRLFACLWHGVHSWFLCTDSSVQFRDFLSRPYSVITAISQIGPVALVAALVGLAFCRSEEESVSGEKDPLPSPGKFRTEVFVAWTTILCSVAYLCYAASDATSMSPAPDCFGWIQARVALLMLFAVRIAVFGLVASVLSLAYFKAQARLCQRLQTLNLNPAETPSEILSGLRRVLRVLCGLAVLGAGWTFVWMIVSPGPAPLKTELCLYVLVGYAWNWFGLSAHCGTMGEIVGRIHAAVRQKGGAAVSRSGGFRLVEFYAYTMIFGGLVRAVLCLCNGLVLENVILGASALVGCGLWAFYILAMVKARRELQSLDLVPTTGSEPVLVVLRVFACIGALTGLAGAILYLCTAPFPAVGFSPAKPSVGQVLLMTMTYAWVAWSCFGAARFLSMMEGISALCGALVKRGRESL